MVIDCEYEILLHLRSVNTFSDFLRSSVRVGEYDTSSDPDCASTGFCAPRSVNHAISHVIVHPDYKQGQYHHDIALLVLKTPLNYSGKLKT